MQQPIIAGWRAAELLADGQEARVVASLSASIYVDVRGELLWLGGPDGVLHPRAVLLPSPPEPAGFVEGQPICVPAAAARVWRPRVIRRDAAADVRHGAVRLKKCSTLLGPPKGFGARLAGELLPFPLAAVASDADLLASACADDDADLAAEAALRLLGVGGGLTPSGDDYVGGAFFARSVLAHAALIDAARWRRAAERIRAAATRATHPVSATLLGDLLDGQAWAPLHDLARALADDDARAMQAAAVAVARLGHSSGWDLLAGFAAGIGG